MALEILSLTCHSFGKLREFIKSSAVRFLYGSVKRDHRNGEKNMSKIVRRLKRAAFRLSGHTRFGQSFPARELQEALSGRTDKKTAMTDHLSTIFFHTVAMQPRFIVELGTRKGDSTRALLAAAKVCNATVLSVDIDNCGNLDLLEGVEWHFVQRDDVAFGRDEFHTFCADHGLPRQADIIFLDTSHHYEHTRSELEVWMQHLAPGGLMFFHDTHMGKGIYVRLDGSLGHGWDNQRGVIRAIEEYMGRRYQEDSFFADVANGFAVYHYPNSSGLTLLKKVE